jgi:hypothetical protein
METPSMASKSNDLKKLMALEALADEAYSQVERGRAVRLTTDAELVAYLRALSERVARARRPALR